MSATQTKLNLQISTRTVLLDLNTVRAALGVDAESVLHRVDNGELGWVFNIALGREKRDLRFYAREIIAPESVAGADLNGVIRNILGEGATLRRGEIERQWIVSHVTVGRWIVRGELELLMPGKISRYSLEQFLRARWQGNGSGECRMKNEE